MLNTVRTLNPHKTYKNAIKFPVLSMDFDFTWTSHMTWIGFRTESLRNKEDILYVVGFPRMKSANQTWSSFFNAP